MVGSLNKNFIGKALSVFLKFFYFVDNFSNFFFHKNHVWTTTKIYKKNQNQSILPFSSHAHINEQHFIYNI